MEATQPLTENDFVRLENGYAAQSLRHISDDGWCVDLHGNKQGDNWTLRLGLVHRERKEIMHCESKFNRKSLKSAISSVNRHWVKAKENENNA